MGVLEKSLVDSSPRKMIRLKRCLKSGKKQEQIENVTNSVNPNLYRRCHLEFARQFTLKSQGGYIELDDPEKINQDEESLASMKMDPSDQEEKRSLTFLASKVLSWYGHNMFECLKFSVSLCWGIMMVVGIFFMIKSIVGKTFHRT